jgi:hypothetical protein
MILGPITGSLSEAPAKKKKKKKHGGGGEAKDRGDEAGGSDSASGDEEDSEAGEGGGGEDDGGGRVGDAAEEQRKLRGAEACSQCIPCSLLCCILVLPVPPKRANPSRVACPWWHFIEWVADWLVSAACRA